MHQDPARTHDITHDQTPPERVRMTVVQAASHLGISAEAVRARIQRGTLLHTKEDGKVYVLFDRHDDSTDGDSTHHHDVVHTDDQTAWISELRGHNTTLREQVDHLRAE